MFVFGVKSNEWHSLLREMTDEDPAIAELHVLTKSHTWNWCRSLLVQFMYSSLHPADACTGFDFWTPHRPVL